MRVDGVRMWVWVWGRVWDLGGGPVVAAAVATV